MTYPTEFDIYLRNTAFIDSEHASVTQYANEVAGHLQSNKQKAIALYNAVRDDILYDPYHLVLNPALISASQTLQRKSGYCIEKSLLLAAAARALGIPSRLGFSIVRNHLSTPKFVEMLRTDMFVFHGYNEFWLDDKWVKCTPAFNRSLCERFQVLPLEFDGEQDSVFHEFENGKKYMEYIHEYGQFDDLPYALFVDELKKYYPHLFDKNQVRPLQWDTTSYQS